MTQPDETTALGRGTDVTVDPADLDEPQDTPASSDGDQMVDDDDGELGGTGGGNAGGAG